MKRTVSEISRRKNLSSNLPRYANTMNGWYHEFASVRLALNYHVFCDIMRESAQPNAELDGYAERFSDIMADGFDGNPSEDKLAQVMKLRERIMDRMQIFTAYTDIFHLYEYVLNRVEYRFREGGLPENYSDDAFCREIMKYIVSDEQPSEVNRKTAEVLGQLPVRLTKQKFFEILDSGLSVYMGTDRSGLDDFLYMLRMSAMLDEPDPSLAGFENLRQAKKEFAACDYANITEEEYRRLADRLGEISLYLNDTSEQYTFLMEMLNDAYILLKTNSGRPLADPDVLSACDQLMKVSRTHGAANTPEEAEADDVDLLVSLEGVQEELSDRLNTWGYLVDELCTGDQEDLSRLGLLNAFEDLQDMAKLTSSSIFVSLERKKAEEIMVDEVYLEQKKEILHRDLEKVFSENARLVRRSVMATVISQLPVFFENLNSLQDFVYNSLSQCRDNAEKIACVEVISSLLADGAR